MILEICLYSHYYKRRPNAPNLILPDRQRAPRHPRSVTAGSRSILTRLSSAKTSVILYDKKIGGRLRTHVHALYTTPSVAPSKDKSIAQRGRTPISSARQMSKRVKSKQLRMMARGTLASVRGGLSPPVPPPLCPNQLRAVA